MNHFKEYVTKNIGVEKEKREGNQWQEKHNKHTHICKNLHYNFLDGQVPMYCDLKGTKSKGNKIHYHRWAKCLTSSQVMCISFFKKFFDGNEKLLLELFRQCGLRIDPQCSVKNAVFEYEPDALERTNFDFYLELSNGQKISFEVKYAEQEFGGTSVSKEEPDKYEKKWELIYKDMVEKCPYFVDETKCQADAFYRHYQISRNIVHAKSANDIVVFLTPRQNQKLDVGRRYIDDFMNENIVNLYWEEVLDKLLFLVEGNKALESYYGEFITKYFWFFRMNKS